MKGDRRLSEGWECIVGQSGVQSAGMKRGERQSEGRE
jgi:hypothetical protein